MSYKIELVGTSAPYIALGFVKNTSIINGRVEFTRSKKNALVINNNMTYDMVMALIKKHNANQDRVNVMAWITEFNGSKRVFPKDIRW